MKIPRTLAAATLGLALALAWPARAQEPTYAEGSVWSLTFVKVKPGMLETYLRDLAGQRAATMAEAKKEGLVLSEMVLTGEASGRDDFDLMLLVEYRNWAALDGLNDKLGAVARRAAGAAESPVQMAVKRADMREIVGSKTMQQLVLRAPPAPAAPASAASQPAAAASAPPQAASAPAAPAASAPK